jgi:hypothetical protein
VIFKTSRLFGTMIRACIRLLFFYPMICKYESQRRMRTKGNPREYFTCICRIFCSSFCTIRLSQIYNSTCHPDTPPPHPPFRLLCWNFRTIYGGQEPSMSRIVIPARQRRYFLTFKPSRQLGSFSVPSPLDCSKIPAQAP